VNTFVLMKSLYALYATSKGTGGEETIVEVNFDKCWHYKMVTWWKR